MKREIPKSLEEKQKLQRESTQFKIQNAIDNLKSLGYENITPALIAKETGLAKSTLNKSHAVEILKINKVWIYKDKKVIASERIERNHNEIITELQKELAKSREKIKKLGDKLLDAESKQREYRLNLIEQKNMYSEVVGKFQTLYERVIALGIKIKI